MLSRWGRHWLLMVAIVVAMTNGLAVAAPTSMQAAPGSLLQALTIVCSPQGAKHLDQHDGSSHTDPACDHCTLCPISVASLPATASVVVSPLSQAAPVAAAVGHDAPRADTISHRPLGQAPPAFLR